MRRTRPFHLLVFAFLFMAGCYYDNEEYLYPDGSGCDTTNITYSGSIAPIMQSTCIGCHASSIASGGVILDNYNGVSTVANNGKLWGAVNHESGYPQMPQGGPKLSDCNLTKIDIWIRAGAQNN